MIYWTKYYFSLKWRDEIDQQEEMNQGGETNGWDAVRAVLPFA